MPKLTPTYKFAVLNRQRILQDSQICFQPILTNVKIGLIYEPHVNRQVLIIKYSFAIESHLVPESLLLY
jgi:hypothetical protein